MHEKMKKNVGAGSSLVRHVLVLVRLGDEVDDVAPAAIIVTSIKIHDFFK